MKKLRNKENKKLRMGPSRNFSISQFLNFSRGFTMVEIVIMLSIIVIISAIVLVSFPSVSGSINLQRTAQSFALHLRQAQSQALAVREVQGQVPPGVGINVKLSQPTSYIFFADMNLNRIYDAGSDVVIETVSVRPNVVISGLNDELGGEQSVINVVFRSPDADTTIYNESGSIGESALIIFSIADGSLTRGVRVRTSGQVSVESSP